VVSDDVVRLIIGAIGVRSCSMSGSASCRRRAGRVRASGVFWGGASAFTSTIASAGMPPFSVHVLPQRMDKMRSSAPSRCSSRAVNLMRLVPYYGLGQLTRETLLISLALMPLAIANNFLGFWLVQRIPTGPF
jgi:hypothetical protein